MQQEYEIRFPVMSDGILRLILIFSLAFVAETFADLFADADSFLLTLSFGQNFQPLSLITHFFVTGSPGLSGLMHLLFELLILWSFGSELDRLWGTRNFYGFFFLSQLGAAILTVGAGFALGFPFIAFGFGPALSAVMLAYAVLWPNRQALFFFFIPMRMKWIVLIFFLLLMIGGWNNMVLHLSGILAGGALLYFRARSGRLHLPEAYSSYSYSTRSSSQPGGLAAGGAGTEKKEGLARQLRIRFDEWKKRRRLDRKRREIDRRIEMKDEVDRLLEKISREGMQSLTRKEKAILDRASKEL